MHRHPFHLASLFLMQIGIAFWLGLFAWKVTWLLEMSVDVDGSRQIGVIRIVLEATVCGLLVESSTKPRALQFGNSGLIALLFLFPFTSNYFPSVSLAETLLGSLYLAIGLLGLLRISMTRDFNNRILCSTLCIPLVLLGCDCLLLQDLTPWHWDYYLPLMVLLMKAYFLTLTIASVYTLSRNLRPLKNPRLVFLSTCTGVHSILWWGSAFKGV